MVLCSHNQTTLKEKERRERREARTTTTTTTTTQFRALPKFLAYNVAT